MKWRSIVSSLFMITLVVVISVSFLSSSANAWPWGRRYVNHVTVKVSWPAGINTAQAKAHYKAQIMASRGVMSHGVAPLVAAFEGIGCGTSAKCGTCTPHRGMTLVADASVFSSKTGRWYRVRGWR